MADLSETDLQMLACEAEWWQRRGSKDQAVADVFGWTPTEYYRRLNLLIDRPEAVAHAPVVVGRLRDLRARRARTRSIRRLAATG